MLQLSASLLNKPVLSLRTGARVATVTGAIFNPNNLKIEGFYCVDRFNKQRLVLLYQDIRETAANGFIVDDHDVLTDPGELIRLKGMMEINFELIGKSIRTVSGDKIGKVSDYAVETTTMYVQKLYAAQSLLKNFTGGSLSIDRSQIVEITDRQIIINDLLQPTPSAAAATI